MLLEEHNISGKLFQEILEEELRLLKEHNLNFSQSLGGWLEEFRGFALHFYNHKIGKE